MLVAWRGSRAEEALREITGGSRRDRLSLVVVHGRKVEVNVFPLRPTGGG
jgi:hypothetical protein